MADQERRSLNMKEAFGALIGALLAWPTAGAQTRPVPTPPALKPSVAPAGALQARITGTVFDSVALWPLEGALVQLVAGNDPSRIRSARTNNRGVFTIDSVAFGVYLLGFLHDRLDTLGIESPLRRVEVQSTGDISVSLATPSPATLIGQRCGAGTPGEARTLYMGMVRSARNAGITMPARVRAQWSEVTLGPKGIERRAPSRYITASESGAFAFCGVPIDVPITARAFSGSDSSGVVELPPLRNGLLVRDLYIGMATRVLLGDAPPVRSVLRGRGRLRGVVRTVDGQPLAGARLVMWGSDVQAMSNAQGQFIMNELPSGTYTLESRALGFQPVRVAVDVREEAEAVAQVAMDASVATVDTMRVRAQANRGAVPLEEFERRRKTGFGHFIDESQVAARQALYMADLFRSTPGMTIMPGQTANDQVLMRSSGSGGSCVPAVFVNGLAIPTSDGVLDTFVNPQDVRAIEIYSRVASVPLQFQSRNGCGSIVLWTGARRSPPTKR